MDEVAFVNERQDERMEEIEEGALSLVPRVMSVEEENRQLREVQQAQEERIVRDGERIRELERSVGTLRTLINSLVETCQEIGLVAFMFFFELLFSYVSSSISFYVSFSNLFPIILFPYLLITRDIQDKGEAGFRLY